MCIFTLFFLILSTSLRNAFFDILGIQLNANKWALVSINKTGLTIECSWIFTGKISSPPCIYWLESPIQMQITPVWMLEIPTRFSVCSQLEYFGTKANRKNKFSLWKPYFFFFQMFSWQEKCLIQCQGVHPILLGHPVVTRVAYQQHFLDYYHAKKRSKEHSGDWISYSYINGGNLSSVPACIS